MNHHKKRKCKKPKRSSLNNQLSFLVITYLEPFIFSEHHICIFPGVIFISVNFLPKSESYFQSDSG